MSDDVRSNGRVDDRFNVRVDDRFNVRVDDRFKEAFAEALVRFRADPRSDELLATLPASAWNRNGCMAFATALAECLGGTLVSIGWYAQLADHVAVAFGGMLLDAEGAYEERELVTKRSLLARAPLGIWPVTASTVTPAVGDDRLRIALVALLASYLPNVPENQTNETPVLKSVERRRRTRKAVTPQNSKNARV